MAVLRTCWAVPLMGLFALVVLAAALGLADDASARTIRVPDNYNTVMKAVDMASPGDTVLVSSGYYEEDFIIRKSITLQGTAASTTVFANYGHLAVVTVTSPSVTISNLKIEADPDMVGVMVNGAGGITLSGLIIVNCGTGILCEDGNNLRVEGCTIKGTVDAGLKVVGAPGARYNNIVVKDTTLENNEGAGVWLQDCIYVAMDGLTATGNGGDGVRASGVDHGHLRNSTLSSNRNGLRLHDSHGWKVEDSVFQRNKWNGIELNQSGYEIGNELRRNLVTDNSRATGSSSAGILLFGNWASDNLVERNIVRSNPIGLNLMSHSGGCQHNTFWGNTIKENNYAIWENSGTGPNDYILNNFLSNSINAADINTYSTFDDGELGNFWSDYTSQYPFASIEGAVWSTPYKVILGKGVFDDRPLAYRYEQDAPVINWLKLIDDDVVVPGHPATFGVSVTDASAIATYRWTVLPSNGAESTHTTAAYLFTFTFQEKGLHWLTVKVTDVWGMSASWTIQFNVEDIVPPVADAGPDQTVNLGSVVTLDGTGSSDNHGIASISWVFDPDGLNLRYQASVASITMNRLGIFQAVLFVVDHSGNSATDRVVITVKDLSPPRAVSSGGATISLGDTMTFDGSSSTDNVEVVQWRWTVNRNGVLIVTIVQKVFEYTFTELGSYEVTLTVTDAAGNSDGASDEVLVLDTDPPTADAGRDQQVLMGTSVVLDARGSSDNVAITLYEWNMLYGPRTEYLFGETVTWQFDRPGEFLVTLVVFDAAGNHDTDVTVVTVVDTVPPVARFWHPGTVKLGETVTVDASGSEDNVGVKAYEWQVQHKDRSDVHRGVMAELTIDTPGTYKVTLTVRDAAGNEGTEDWTFYVAPKSTETAAPSWLVPGMVAVLAAAVLVGYLYARRRYAVE